MIKQKKNGATWVAIFFLFWLTTAYAQQGPSEFVQKLVKIEQYKLKLEQQQHDYVQQEALLQQKIAHQQEHLLYNEQEDKEWRVDKQQELLQLDAAINKLEKDADFAESERLKAKKREKEQEIAAQKDQNKAELNKRHAKLNEYQQGLDHLKKEREKIAADRELKIKKQQQMVDTLVAKAVPLRASNDVKALRYQAAEFKNYIMQLKASALKERESFVRVLQVPLESIEHRITYLEKSEFEGFTKKINRIKKNIVAAKHPEELMPFSLAIEELKKAIGSSILLTSRQNDLYNRIRSELEPLLAQKASTDQVPAEPIAVVASKNVVQEAETIEQEVVPEPVVSQPEVKQSPSVTSLPIEKSPKLLVKQEVKPETKQEKRSVAAFVLDKVGESFNPIEYRNVLITTDSNDRVTAISYNNKTIPLIVDPLMARESSSHWIAAEIYVHQVSGDQNYAQKLLDLARVHYMQQAGYDSNDLRYNVKLFDFLRAGLIPVLEAKLKR